MTQQKVQELQQVLETVDVLRLLVARGQEEMQAMAPYLLAFGAYGLVNTIFAAVSHGRGLWLETLFPAFALAVFLQTKSPLTLLLWAVAAAMTWGVYLLWPNPAVIWTAVFVTVAIVMAVIHIALPGKFRERLVLMPRVGIGWSMLIAGMWLVVSSPVFRQVGNAGELFGALFGYAIGVGLLLTSVLHAPFFWVGLVGMFGVPAAVLYLQNWVVATFLFALMGAAMMWVGLSFLRSKESVARKQ